MARAGESLWTEADEVAEGGGRVFAGGGWIGIAVVCRLAALVDVDALPALRAARTCAAVRVGDALHGLGSRTGQLGIHDHAARLRRAGRHERGVAGTRLAKALLGPVATTLRRA